jgi:hypothetical protein
MLEKKLTNFQIAFWDTVGAIDVLIDVAIMALPILVIRNVQLPLSKKVAVVSAFSFRLLAIGMTIFRLVTLPPSLRKDPSRTNAFATGPSADLSMTAYLPTIATLLATFASIFAACVPHLRPFMDSLQAGFLSGVIHDSVENRTSYGNGDSYAMNKVGVSSRTDPPATMRSQRSVEAVVLKNANGQILVETPADIDMALQTNEAVAARGRRQRRNSSASDGDASHGSHGSDAMIIKQTKEWSVTYER